MELSAYRQRSVEISYREIVCREFGFEPPVICTPEELMEPER